MRSNVLIVLFLAISTNGVFTMNVPDVTSTQSNLVTTLAPQSIVETTLAPQSNVETTLAPQSNVETTLAPESSTMVDPESELEKTEIMKQFIDLLDKQIKGFYILPFTIQLLISTVLNALMWCFLPNIRFFNRLLMNKFSKELSLIANAGELTRFR
jgi:hypothetical protein